MKWALAMFHYNYWLYDKVQSVSIFPTVIQCTCAFSVFSVHVHLINVGNLDADRRKICKVKGTRCHRYQIRKL